MKSLYELFQRCLSVPYIHTDNSADYYTEYADDVLYLYLEASSGAEDWANNVDFPVTPYKEMGNERWYCHRGFLRVFKSLENTIIDIIKDEKIKKIITVGYSHGGALATLCHELIWYNRPDLRDSQLTLAFGAPRVLYGIRWDYITSRFDRFYVIRNIDDIVTHLPPAVLGYFHPGTLIEIGEKGKYSRVNAHRPQSYLQELQAFEKLNKITFL